MLRATIYTRVSSDPNDTLKSVEEQEAECRGVCNRERWRVVKVFKDNDRGASRHSRKDRPGYGQLREFLAAGGADVLVLWEGSRAQRDLRDYLRLRDLCADSGILYSYSGRTYDLTRTDDRFSTGLDALLAERESDQTRDRVLRAMRANAEKGRPHGKLLFGYTREYDSTGVFLRQIERADQAVVVREAAERARHGEACRAIAVDFNGRGILTPRAWILTERAERERDTAKRTRMLKEASGYQWDLTQIRRLVANPAYAGIRVHKGVRLDPDTSPAVWPAILDAQVWAECVARVEDPRRRTVRDTAIKHLLTGALRCGVCGAVTRVLKNRGYPGYQCAERFCVSVTTHAVEKYVTEAVLARLARPDALALLTPPDAAGKAQQAGLEAAKLRARLEGMYAQAAVGKLTPMGLGKVEKQLLPLIEDAEQRAQLREVPVLLRDLARPDPASVWDGLTIGQRREVVALMMDLRVNTTGRGTRTFDPNRIEIAWRQA